MAQQFFATCKMGLEALVARELRALGIEVTRTEDARVFFTGGWDALARANLWLRTAERVFLMVGQCPAHSFEELFEGVRAMPWTQYLGEKTAFPVRGKTAKSALFSVSDAQRIVKKAVVGAMQRKYKCEWFAESGETVQLEFGLLRDEATLALDASGAGLARRGYRTLNAEAPLSETLGAAMVMLAGWRANQPFCDPMCGSGTLPVEAAMIGQRIAPGLKRAFSAEAWPFMEDGAFVRARQEAQDAIIPAALDICGSDVDERVLDLARQHAGQAGVQVRFAKADVRSFAPEGEYGVVACNPPYGERLGNLAEVEALYRDMGRVFRQHSGWTAAILTMHPNFERIYGARADKRRKLYNAKLPCQLYLYWGAKPDASDR